jgi:hypothetical protein
LIALRAVVRPVSRVTRETPDTQVKTARLEVQDYQDRRDLQGRMDCLDWQELKDTHHQAHVEIQVFQDWTATPVLLESRDRLATVERKGRWGCQRLEYEVQMDREDAMVDLDHLECKVNPEIKVRKVAEALFE